jgi:hypothetical protein
MDRKENKQIPKIPSSIVTKWPNTEPVSQEYPKKWKKTLAVEWLWFVLTLLLSWLVANILEYYIPIGAEVIAIILFALVYLTRLTIWAVKEAGKE